MHALLCAGIVIALTTNAVPDTSSTPVARVGSYLQAWHDTDRFTGVALVARRDTVLYAKGFGWANAEWHAPNTPDTRFAIGSITKQFTAVMILQLAAEGKVDLDAPITRYLAEYRKDTGDRVTIEHLLQHTSGIRSFTGLPDFWTKLIRNPYPPETAIRELHSGDLEFEPGSRYRYNNTGYCLLAAIIERQTGKSYDENLRERILAPLGMANTGPNTPEVVVPLRATGYTPTPLGFFNAPYSFGPNLLGTGHLYSTAGDLRIWNQALHAGRLLPPGLQARMFAVHHREDPTFGHATSVDVMQWQPDMNGPAREFTCFSGGLLGFHTDAFHFLDDDLVVVLFSNAGEVDFWRIAPAVRRILDGGSVDAPKRRLSDELARIATTAGVESAAARFHELQSAPDTRYEAHDVERDLNATGYRLMRVDRVAAAIGVFTLNATLFPQSANAQDSLAEALERAGQTDLAKEHYARAKELAGFEDEILALLTAGRYDEAERAVGGARTSAPQRAVFSPPRIGPLFSRLLAEGKTDAALHVCHVWALGNPADVGPYFSMARVYRQLGQDAEARRCYERVVALAPDAPSAARAREELAKLPQP